LIPALAAPPSPLATAGFFMVIASLVKIDKRSVSGWRQMRSLGRRWGCPRQYLTAEIADYRAAQSV
jgi:hypothetical protein